MAQTAQPLSGEGTPRPLPRGGRSMRSRDTRPRFQALDALWMVFMASLIVFIGVMRRADTSALLAATGVVLLTYLTGWRASGRPAAVISGLLLATSVPFLSSMTHVTQTDLFALITLGALFAFVAGSSLAALLLAAGAVWLRADGLVLGLMLLAFTLIQHRQRAWIGALLFFVPALAALIVPHADGGHPFAGVTFGFHPTLLVCLAAPATLFASWFLLPFFGEMADPVRRARWLPTVVWTAFYTILSCTLTFSHHGPVPAALVPFLPLWFLLVGAGLARLLPVMTGDLPIPWLRYAVATLAVLSLLTIRARVEWVPAHSLTAASPHLPVPASPVAVIPPPSNPKAVPGPPRPIPAHPVAPAKTAQPRPTQVVKNKASKTAPPKQRAINPRPKVPTVRQYVVKNGQRIRRSKWAIEWDLTHPGH